MNSIWLKLALPTVAGCLLVVSGCGDDNAADGDVPHRTAAELESQDSGVMEPAPCRASQITSESFGATSEEWVRTKCSQAENFGVVEGRCADGTELLLFFTGTSSETRLFDASGTFRGYQLANEGGGPCNITFWPSKIDCGEATVTRVVCGRQILAVGDRLPY